MGENVTTLGVDLLGLPVGTRLHLRDAVVEVTSLRNPCAQLDRIQPGLWAGPSECPKFSNKMEVDLSFTIDWD